MKRVLILMVFFTNMFAAQYGEEAIAKAVGEGVGQAISNKYDKIPEKNYTKVCSDTIVRVIKSIDLNTNFGKHSVSYCVRHLKNRG